MLAQFLYLITHPRINITTTSHLFKTFIYTISDTVINMGSVAQEVFRGCGQISAPFIPRIKPTGNNDHGEELALDTRSLWPNGSVLTVKIVG